MKVEVGLWAGALHRPQPPCEIDCHPLCPPPRRPTGACTGTPFLITSLSQTTCSRGMATPGNLYPLRMARLTKCYRSCQRWGQFDTIQAALDSITDENYDNRYLSGGARPLCRTCDHETVRGYRGCRGVDYHHHDHG
jgi:hypothetical protein